jgi:ABC-2 type transport system permease protein
MSSLRVATAIAERELRAYLFSASGYIIIALFMLVTGIIFSLRVFEQGAVSSLRDVFGAGTWLLAFIAPAITMRLFSEEYRLGTFEGLMTAPVRNVQVVAGKFGGALALLIVMLLPTLIFVVALEIYGRPDYGEVATGYFGLVLAGALYLASGMVASILTSSQPVAFLVTLFFWLAIGFAARELPALLNEEHAAIIYAADPRLRLNDFCIGLGDTSNVMYFVTLTLFFLLTALAVLEVRRCR